MSARIPDTTLLSDLLKPTGYDCPERLQGKTFEESTTGEGNISIEANKEITISENGTTVINPSEGKDVMEKVTVNVNVPSSGGGGSSGGGSSSGGGAFRYFDARKSGYGSSPLGFWVIGKNQVSGTAHCLILSGGRSTTTDSCFQTILRITEAGLTVSDYDREAYPEVTEDVVAAALEAN